MSYHSKLPPNSHSQAPAILARLCHSTIPTHQLPLGLMGPSEVEGLSADHQALCYIKGPLYTHIDSLYPTSWDTHCPPTCRLSGWLGHSSLLVLPSLCTSC